MGFVLAVTAGRVPFDQGRDGIGQAPLGGVDHHAVRQAIPVGFTPEPAHTLLPDLSVEVFLANDGGHLIAGMQV